MDLGDNTEYSLHDTTARAFETCFMLLVDLYDPTEDIKRAPNQVFAKIFLWFFQLIAFFILLNALLAIIVESYDRTKAAAEIHKVQPMRRRALS